jgi:ArsR family transcriptional regulator
MTTTTAPTKAPSRGKRATAAPAKKKSASALATREEITENILRRSTVDAYTEVFRALSEPTRIEILSLIASCDDEYPCTQLERVLPVTKSTISYHIKILSGAGLVQVRKEGRYYHYRVRRNVIDFFLPGFLEHLADDRDD